MKKIILTGLMILSINVYSDSFSSSPQCYKPNKPLIYSPTYYIARYKQDIIEYNKCVNNFISKQEHSIQLHKKSIEQARELLKQQEEISNAAFLSF